MYFQENLLLSSTSEFKSDRGYLGGDPFWHDDPLLGDSSSR
ncbi:hypothetical protein [Calothrix sp. 336/3]|nr:hypothetical protein [Calothrix sp. 336/3]